MKIYKPFEKNFLLYVEIQGGILDYHLLFFWLSGSILFVSFIGEVKIISELRLKPMIQVNSVFHYIETAFLRI